jgi:putative flippase GtrA
VRGGSSCYMTGWMSLRALASQVGKFIVSGGIAAFFNIATGWVLRRLFGETAHVAAVAAGFTVGTVISFVLNRTFTFRATSGDVRKQAIRYLVVAVAGIGLAAVIAAGLEHLLRSFVGDALSSADVGDLAHVGAIGLNTIYTFIAIKYFALRVPAQVGRST